MNEDKIDKLLKSVDLLIDRNNIINEQVTRILFLCLNNQDILNIKNNLLDELTKVNENLSKDISGINENLLAVKTDLYNYTTSVNNNLSYIISAVNENFSTVNGKLSNINISLEKLDKSINKTQKVI